jgi:hypothetical protein
MPYGTVNADVITTSTAGGVLGAGDASLMKNRIINGAMTISQYNGTSSVTITNTSASTYVLDRWNVYGSQASKFSVQQNAGSVTPPVGYSKYLGITSLSAYSVLTADYFNLAQYIEGFNIADLGWGTANAKTVTLSFQVYSSLTGTFGGAVNNVSNYSYPFTYSIPVANTWTTISVTIAGPTAGTWTSDNSRGIGVSFGLGSGATGYAGTAGSWSANYYITATGATSVVGTNGATFYITGVQLEVGSSATGYEYRQYGTELDLCSRYCFVQGWPQGGATYSYYVLGLGYAENASIFTAYIPYPVSMRTKPSLTSSVSNTFYTNYFTPDSSAAVLDQASKDSGLVNISGSSGVAGKAGRFMVNGTQTCYLIWSAEL